MAVKCSTICWLIFTLWPSTLAGWQADWWIWCSEVFHRGIITEWSMCIGLAQLKMAATQLSWICSCCTCKLLVTNLIRKWLDPIYTILAYVYQFQTYANCPGMSRKGPACRQRLLILVQCNAKPHPCQMAASLGAWLVSSYKVYLHGQYMASFNQLGREKPFKAGQYFWLCMVVCMEPAFQLYALEWNTKCMGASLCANVWHICMKGIMAKQLVHLFCMEELSG